MLTIVAFVVALGLLISEAVSLFRLSQGGAHPAPAPGAAYLPRPVAAPADAAPQRKARAAAPRPTALADGDDEWESF